MTFRMLAWMLLGVITTVKFAAAVALVALGVGLARRLPAAGAVV